MKSSPILQRVLMIAGVTVALWAAGAGRASAQCPEEGPCVVPPQCVDEDDFSSLAVAPVPLNCTVAEAVFTPENHSWTYFFDANNSINIKTQVNEPFFLTVELRQMTQAEYALRVAGTPFVGSECWPTFGTGGTDCVFYRVHGESVARDSYGPVVNYIVGFTSPAIKGNKHDLMLLRSSEDSSPIPYDGFVDSSFDEEITTKVLRNYKVGQDDPGVGGGASGLSDYTVAFQRVRPVSKKK